MPKPSQPVATLREDFPDWHIDSCGQETACGPPYIGYVASRPGDDVPLRDRSPDGLRRQLEAVRDQ